MVQFTSALLLLSAATSVFATECFYPAGNPARDNVPCDDNAAVSTCCASKEQCLTNGLCLVTKDPNTVEYARGACTDETWGPGCFPQCLISHPGSPVTNGAAVFMCNSTGWLDPKGASYCCEKSVNQKTGCCAGGDTFWLPAGGVVSLPSSSAPAPAPPSSSAAAPSVTTVDSFTTTTVPCTTSTIPSSSLPAQSNTTSSDVVISSTSSEPVSTPIVGTGVTGTPTNGTVTPIAPTAPVATGAASKYQIAGFAGLVGAFAFGLL